ncbi:nucleoside hydrolase [Haliea sp. E17]|uniref:nucleoside hydrolase n=1 Tax=Haliea sp. E17 TaxID=3401576 RepID=UPI003AAE6658
MIRIALFALAIVLAPGARAAIPVIFDNDMAIDDWSTLLYLARDPEVELLAVTVAGSGEAHCAPAVANALALLQLAGAADSIPVSCGDPWPLDGYFVFPVPWQEDMDILSGVEIPPATRQPDGRHAVDVIHASLQASDEPVVLLATGPMTNLAQWLQRYPGDRDRVSRVVVMGGSLDAPGNIIVPKFTDGHPNTGAEWNFYIDPLAADILLRSGLPVEMVGLDVTNTVRVTAAFAADFKARADNPAADFWDQVLDRNDWFIASGEYYLWDVLAALTVVDPATFCKGESLPLAVDHGPAGSVWEAGSDPNMPATRWDGQPRAHLDAGGAGVVLRIPEGPQTKVCLQTDGSAAFKRFTAVMTDS